MKKLSTDRSLEKTKDLRKLPKVKVEWCDATADGGWKTFDSMRKEDPVEVTSIGYMIRNDKHRVQVVQSVCSNGKVAESLTIPKGWIKSVKVVN